MSGQDGNQRILQGVERYYTGKVQEHGETSRGVDWNSKESQYLRFEQLCRVLPSEGPIDVVDLGCGYGELVSYLDERYPGRPLRYAGHDLSTEMIARARERFKGRSDARFSTDAPAPASCDHAIASGLFNVRLDLATDAEWLVYMEATLRALHACSRKGFAFNALTIYSDADRMKPTLYYADPLRLFDLCKREFARDVALLHDYGLYEFTILVRK